MGRLSFSVSIIFALSFFAWQVDCYDTTDLEIFDLVEEIGQQQSFYDVLQISQVSRCFFLISKTLRFF